MAKITLADGERIIGQAEIEAEWLGHRPEAILTSQWIVLHDRVGDSLARVPLSDVCDLKATERELAIRTTAAPGWIDFAGRVFDGWYPMIFHDEQQQIEFTDQLLQAVDALGRNSVKDRARIALQREPRQPAVASWPPLGPGRPE